jgi:hypothetical protein
VALLALVAYVVAIRGTGRGWGFDPVRK